MSQSNCTRNVRKGNTFNKSTKPAKDSHPDVTALWEGTGMSLVPGITITKIGDITSFDKNGSNVLALTATVTAYFPAAVSSKLVQAIIAVDGDETILYLLGDKVFKDFDIYTITRSKWEKYNLPQKVDGQSGKRDNRAIHMPSEDLKPDKPYKPEKTYKARKPYKSGKVDKSEKTYGARKPSFAKTAKATFVDNRREKKESVNLERPTKSASWSDVPEHKPVPDKIVVMAVTPEITELIDQRSPNLDLNLNQVYVISTIGRKVVAANFGRISYWVLTEEGLIFIQFVNNELVERSFVEGDAMVKRAKGKVINYKHVNPDTYSSSAKDRGEGIIPILKFLIFIRSIAGDLANGC